MTEHVYYQLLCDHTSLMFYRGFKMKKLLSVISLASIVTFSLFVFMAYLVNSDEVNIVDPLPDVIVDVYQTKPEKPAVDRVKKLPEPPKAPEPMPKVMTEIDPTSPTDEVGEILVNVKVPSTTLGTGDIFTKPDHDARPIVRISPKYPITAARDGIEGWVKLAFDINKVGEVVNISILDSYPKRTFDKAAKQALKRWKYKAKLLNGKTVYQTHQTVQLDFNMDQQI